MTLAQQMLNSKTDLPTNLGTAALRQLGNDILRQSLLSARMTNADAVQGLRAAITRILTSVGNQSTDNLAEARLKLKQLGAWLGYEPKTGFPDAPEGAVPPAEAGSLTDLFSTDRLNLLLKTQEMMSQGAAKNIWGNNPAALEQYPAWELVRVAAVEVPRGEERRKGGLVEVPEDAWDSSTGRWAAACDEAADDEAQKIFDATGRMMARKDSDVWQALGDGAGGYDDTLGNDYEPFAFNSGMGRVEVSAQEFAELGGSDADLAPSDTEFGSDEVALRKQRFDPDILKTLQKSMASGDLKFRVKVEVVP